MNGVGPTSRRSDDPHGRIDNEVFFDRGVQMITRVHEPSDTSAINAERIQTERFFRAPAPPWRDVLGRLAISSWRLGGIMAVAGFLAVFVNQAPLFMQLVLGAPIFEELLKFGIALLLSGWMRLRILRVPVALAVGAGFGWLEHTVTYSSEEVSSMYWRIVFHAVATGTSMAIFQGLEALAELRARWGAPIVAIIVHYLNNFLAIPVAFTTAAAGVPQAAFWFSNALTGILAGVMLAALVYPAPWARLSRRLLRRLSVIEPVPA